MQTYEYHFESVAVGAEASGLASEPAYQSAIRQRATEGWRLVQVLAPNPMSASYELIFERQQPLLGSPESV